MLRCTSPFTMLYARPLLTATPKDDSGCHESSRRKDTDPRDNVNQVRHLSVLLLVVH